VPDPWVGVLFLVLLALAFLGMAGVLLPMLQSAPTQDSPRHVGESPLSVLAPLVMAVAVLMLGVYIPPALSNVIREAAIALGG
jgi:hypothetical protein